MKPTLLEQTTDMRFLIVEDELVIAESLRKMLRKLGHQCPAVCRNPDEFTDYLSQYTPDLVFLDINFQGVESGFDVAANCKQIQQPFIFLTSYADEVTMRKAMELSPLGYVLKPFSEAEIFKTIELARMRIETNHVLFKDGHDHVKLDFTNIRFLKAENVYTKIFTKTKKYLPRISLTQLLQQLPGNQFLKVHRSFVVNLKFIDRISGDYLVLGDEKVPISRTKKAEILEMLER